MVVGNVFGRLAAVFAVTALFAGCARGDQSHPPVPPLRAETVPKPPVSAQQLVWLPGSWEWNGAGYVWVAGHYVPHAAAGALWLPGHWVQTSEGWVWETGHWL